MSDDGGTIIDALVVALKLDPTQFNKELAQYQKARKAAGDQDERLDKAELERTKKRADAIGEVKKQTLGLFATIVGASGVEKFITTQTTSLAALGRAAGNMGASVRDVSAFSNMIVRNGGDAKSATASLAGLTQAMADFQLTGRTPLLPVLGRIGATEAHQSAVDIYKKYVATIEREHMSAPVAADIGAQLGFDEAEINLALKGTKAVNAELDRSYKIGVANEEQSKRAAALLNSFNALRQSFINAGNIALTETAPYATATLDAITRITSAAPGATAAVIALGTALAGLKAAANLAAIARAVGLLPKAAPAVEAAAGSGALMSAARLAGPVGALAWGVLHPTVANVGEDAQVAALHAQEAKRRAAKGPQGGTVQTGTVQTRADAIAAQLRSYGWSAEATQGILAGMRAENPQLDVRAKPIDPKTGKPLSSAQGLGQWLIARQKDYQKLFPGQDFNASTQEQQVAFLNWELRNTERSAGNAIAGQNSAGAAYNYVTRYMRPGPTGTIGDLQRASHYLHSSPDQMRASASTVTVQIDAITINTKATDPPGIARDIGGEIKRQTIVAQSDAGMR